MNEVLRSIPVRSDDTHAVTPPKVSVGSKKASSLLLPNRRHPYYIVAPQYTRRSAGIKSLHLLCNALNRSGERAYILTHPYSSPDYAINPELLTPVLTRGIVKHDYEKGLAPIMIYPEIIPGNPYGSPFVVRYVLNYPGLLGGDNSYPEEEFCVAYSHELASAVPNTRMTLFLPASDAEIFTPEPRVKTRSGSCYYAGKYREIHHGKLFDITRDSVEIYRDVKRAQTPQEIAELFRRSEVFYVYENTALVIEALMCECPVVFLPNEYLESSIGAGELGWDGIAWGADDAEVRRAKATVSKGRENYMRLFAEFERALAVFVEQTQDQASCRKYDSIITIKYSSAATALQLLAEKMELFKTISGERGLYVAIKRAFVKILRILFRK